MPIKSRATYMQHVHDSPESMLMRYNNIMADSVSRRPRFDTLVGTGLSGCLIVPVLARLLGVHWTVVRKTGDGSHSGRPAEGTLGERWIFVDDLIETGATLRRVKEVIDTMVERHNRNACRSNEVAGKFVGVYLYDSYTYLPASKLDKDLKPKV